MPVILFKKEHQEPILSGVKTITRRFWTEKRATSVMDWIRTQTWVKLKTNRFKKEYFARAIIIDIRFEAPCRMEPEDCAKEGYPDLTEAQFYEQRLCPIAEIPPEERSAVWATGIYRNSKCYRVAFRVMKGIEVNPMVEMPI